ncbi:Kinesin-like protein kif24, partial [Rhizopus stolonifer]
ISMQDYGGLGISSISDRKRLFQLIQTLRLEQQETLSSPTSREFFADNSTQTPFLVPAKATKIKLSSNNNMVGLSSASFAKPNLISPKEPSMQQVIPGNISSPRFMRSSCRSPIVTKRMQLPVYVRKQQTEEESDEGDDEDDREIVKSNNNGLLNPYGLPINHQRQHQKKSDLNQRIRVCVRKRPLSKQEIRRLEKDITPVNGVRTVHVNEPKVKVDLTKYIEQHTFTFDDVFDINDTNDYIYQRTAQPLVKYMFRGGKATCFAYGQTGSGKTYTMMDSKHGLYALAAHDIFQLLQEPEYQHLCAWIGFYEIYQGQLYDLLADRKKLFAREDGKQNVVIVGLKEYMIKNVSDLMQVFEYGNQVRTTGANSDSSRSHAILQVLLKPASAGKKKLVEPIGKLSFIDLAGSERGADRGETDLKTRMEGAEINKSLLALKECIRALDQDKKHTPFRQSKLTQVLKDSFVGNSRTCMIATVSPNQSNSEHTLNTLRYADRVKELGCDYTDEQKAISNVIHVQPKEEEKEKEDKNEMSFDNEDFPCLEIEGDSLLDTEFPHELLSTPKSVYKPLSVSPAQCSTGNHFNKAAIEEFLVQHRAEIRATNECSKKELRHLTNISLEITKDQGPEISGEFIDYLSDLNELLVEKSAAIDRLKDKIRLILE